jgi:hypothetical protein
MAKDPAFLFYHHDFLVGTMLMSLEETGQYITILCHLADKGTLSLEEMRHILNGEPKNKVLSKLSRKTNGRYFNQRLEFEVNKRKEYAKSRRNNRLGSKKNKTYDKHMITHMVNENVNENVIKDDIIIKEFETLWKNYPNKFGRKKALSVYTSLRTKDDEAYEKIKQAIINYKEHIRINKTKAQYIKHGSTFFNNWQDYYKMEVENGSRASIEKRYI